MGTDGDGWGRRGGQLGLLLVLGTLFGDVALTIGVKGDSFDTEDDPPGRAAEGTPAAEPIRWQEFERWFAYEGGWHHDGIAIHPLPSFGRSVVATSDFAVHDSMGYLSLFMGEPHSDLAPGRRDRIESSPWPGDRQRSSACQRCT